MIQPTEEELALIRSAVEAYELKESGVSLYAIGANSAKKFSLSGQVRVDTSSTSIVYYYGPVTDVTGTAISKDYLHASAFDLVAFDGSSLDRSIGIRQLVVPEAMYYDLVNTVSYSIEDGNTLTFYGSAQSSIWAIKVASGDFVDSYSINYPSKAQMLVNGEPVGDVFDFNANLGFSLPEDGVSIRTPGVGVESIGVRFYFTGPSYGTPGTGTSNQAALFGYSINDQITVVQSELTQTEIIIQNIYNAVVNLPQNIYNYFFQGVDPSEGESLKEDAASKREESDQLQQEIEEGVEKPPPEEIVPDITVIIDQTDENYVGYMDAISALLSNSMIVNLLLIVVSMAFVSYVLFGKKE